MARDLFSREDRWRTPISGIRVKLRNELRRLGVRGKFGTDVMRGTCESPKTILVITKEAMQLPITEYLGYRVKNHVRNV